MRAVKSNYYLDSVVLELKDSQGNVVFNHKMFTTAARRPNNDVLAMWIVAKALNMSPGNLTFHYPTKEHLLAVLTDMLCHFQWK